MEPGHRRQGTPMAVPTAPIQAASSFRPGFSLRVPSEQSIAAMVQATPGSGTPSILIRQVSLQQTSAYMPAHIPPQLLKQNSQASAVFVKAPEHSTLPPDAPSDSKRKKPFLTKFCCCCDLRRGFMIISSGYIVVDVITFILAIIAHKYRGQWAFALHIAASLIFLAFDIYGVRVGMKYDLSGILVAITLGLAFLLVFIAVIGIQMYFAICIWSFYMDFRDKPENYIKNDENSTPGPEMKAVERNFSTSARSVLKLQSEPRPPETAAEKKERNRSRAASRAMELGNVVVFS
ncbi:hypothetical protein HDU97_006857 [Phlyctochytrium planicorne]|nr:hypothetical protein HDU97_006857 [Phlyctochytrium planicorne]